MSLTIQNFIAELEKQEKFHSDKLRKIKAAINSAQDICDHDYKYIGNTHRDIEECTVCKHRITV